MKLLFIFITLLFSISANANNFCNGETPNLCVLDQIKTYADTHIEYVPDEIQFGAFDYWYIPHAENMRGDCEDIALYIKNVAEEVGLEPYDLKIARCLLKDSTSTKFDHAILIYKDSWIIDNREQEMVSKSEYADKCKIYDYFIFSTTSKPQYGSSTASNKVIREIAQDE